MSSYQDETDGCLSAGAAVPPNSERASVTDSSEFEEAQNGAHNHPDSDQPACGMAEFDPAALTAPDVTVDSAAAGRFMDLAFVAARDALANQEVPVGCVFIRAGRLLASGRNTVNETKNATRHAEIDCVDLVYERCAAAGLRPGRLWPETDVFVTVEPCVMCAAALIQLGVRSVTYGAANQRFGGCGSVVDVPGKVMTSTVKFVQDPTRVEEAIALLKEFYKGENPNVPRSEG